MDGESNFSPWKEHIVLLLEEVELRDIVEKAVIVPYKTSDATGYATYQKRNVKSKRVILDVVKYFLIPHITGKAKDFDSCGHL